MRARAWLLMVVGSVVLAVVAHRLVDGVRAFRRDEP